MKTPADVVADVRRRLERTWASTAVADMREGGPSWPHSFALRVPQGEALDTQSWDVLTAWVEEWQTWRAATADQGLVLEHAQRRYRGTRQSLPTHLVVASHLAAARLCGGDWPERLACADQRLSALKEAFPHSIDASTLKTLVAYSEVDFSLLLETSAWFRANPRSGLTPRQIPVAGLNSKWLNGAGRRELVAQLAGLEVLGLNESRPHPVNYTYLDPGHRKAGGRMHDSIVPGDRARPAYTPALALVCENRDSAVNFPAVEAAIAIQGAGREGPARLEELLAESWLPVSTCLFYWGDIDAQGLEIVNDYRARGIGITTLLMDLKTLRAFAQFGTAIGADGQPLQRQRRRDLQHLTQAEADLYRELVDPQSQLPIRVEQERIPLAVALDAVLTAVA